MEESLKIVFSFKASGDDQNPSNTHPDVDTNIISERLSDKLGFRLIESDARLLTKNGLTAQRLYDELNKSIDKVKNNTNRRWEHFCKLKGIEP